MWNKTLGSLYKSNTWWYLLVTIIYAALHEFGQSDEELWTLLFLLVSNLLDQCHTVTNDPWWHMIQMNQDCVILLKILFGRWPIPVFEGKINGCPTDNQVTISGCPSQFLVVRTLNKVLVLVLYLNLSVCFRDHLRWQKLENLGGIMWTTNWG